MKSSSETVIKLSTDRIDLPAWLATISDRDYQACSTGQDRSRAPLMRGMEWET